MKEFVAHRMLVQSSLRKKWKTMLLLFVAGIIVVAALFAWNRSHYKSIDNLPSLAQIAETEDEAALNDFIGNFTKQELIAAWGSPNECSRMEVNCTHKCGHCEM